MKKPLIGTQPMFSPFGTPRDVPLLYTARAWALMLPWYVLVGSAFWCPLLIAQSSENEAAPPAPAPATTNLEDLTKSVFNAPRYAVVMGINDYADDGINDLALCEKDATAVYNLLIDPAIGGVPQEHATLLLGEQATANGIRRALSPLSQIPTNSVVFVYYSGHGMKQADEAFWVTQDALKEDLAGTAFSDAEVQRCLKRIPSNRVIVMIDACYAAATAKGNKAVDVSASLKKFTGKGRAILSAAGDGEEAIEAADLEHSVFTYYLLKGLRGAADTNSDGVLVLPEITNYLDEQVADAARARKGVQRPVVDLAGVQEPAKFSVVIDSTRLQAIADANQAAAQLRAARVQILYDFALNEGLTALQYQQGKRLIEADPARLSKQENSLLEVYLRVADQKLPVRKLTKALELASTSRALGVIFKTGKNAGETTEIPLSDTIVIQFRWCPAGTFLMGSPETKGDEAPVSVSFSSGFWLGETEVTQAQWSEVMQSTPWMGQKKTITGANYPAIWISYDEALEFCAKLTELEQAAGRLPADWKYALPTEAQWEYGCRAGSKTKYSFGESESLLSDYGWWGGLNGGGNAQAEKHAHPVGLKQANAWGLQDMHGNVWEWCADWYNEKLPAGIDPTGPAQGLSRVRRGGSWNANASLCRSASRGRNTNDHKTDNQGFRLAVVPARESGPAEQGTH